GLNARGVSVAIPSYDHCPQVSVADIIEEMRRFLAVLWQKTGQHPLVMGHSAGGHLTACMLATDWSGIDDVPEDLVRRAFAVSGIYDLTPICKVSVNEDIRLTEESARAVSPLFWTPPPADRELVAAVGGLESAEFRRQSRELAETWGKAGLTTDYVEIPDANHFTVVNAVIDPEGPYMARIADMALACARS
ncbi:MAG: alpha/beta hydrolase, partial [Alphaproteobacteria bacterium]